MKVRLIDAFPFVYEVNSLGEKESLENRLVKAKKYLAYHKKRRKELKNEIIDIETELLTYKPKPL